jgi:membrane fusion protein, multidrug efflux system
VTLPDGALYEHPGKLNFLDVQVDPGTDTLTVRAELPNPDRVLIASQFVGVRVERGEPKQVLKVVARRVRLGALEGDQVVVEDGLNVGDRVVVEGIQKVRRGMAVAVTAREAQLLGAPQSASQRLSSKG